MRNMDIQPVARTRAHEEVARQLREQIRRGALRAGERLPPERELARRFQVSRATIRQAFSALHSGGVIESRVGAGTFVRANVKSEIAGLAAALRAADASLDDQLGLRRLIEPQIAQLAVEHARQADLDKLRHYLALQEARLREGVPFIEEDSAFHLAIARASGNALLATMVEGIHELLRDSREHSLRAPDGMERSLKGHRAILDAITRRDSLAAFDAMMSHIQDVEHLSFHHMMESQRD